MKLHTDLNKTLSSAAVTHLILYFPFYLWAIFLWNGLSFYWEIVGGGLETIVVILLSSLCFFVGLKRKEAKFKHKVIRFILMSLLYYWLGPTAKPNSVIAYQPFDGAMYFVETNNMAGATSGTTSTLYRAQGSFVLVTDFWQQFYDHNIAAFVVQDNKLYLALSKSYMGDLKEVCVEIDKTQLTDLPCTVLQPHVDFLQR